MELPICTMHMCQYVARPRRECKNQLIVGAEANRRANPLCTFAPHCLIILLKLIEHLEQLQIIQLCCPKLYVQAFSSCLYLLIIFFSMFPGTNKCFVCNKSSNKPILCSVTDCGRFYHKNCIQPTFFNPDNQKLICPLHSCMTCRVLNKVTGKENFMCLGVLIV